MTNTKISLNVKFIKEIKFDRMNVIINNLQLKYYIFSFVNYRNSLLYLLFHLYYVLIKYCDRKKSMYIFQKSMLRSRTELN